MKRQFQGLGLRVTNVNSLYLKRVAKGQPTRDDTDDLLVNRGKIKIKKTHRDMSQSTYAVQFK